MKKQPRSALGEANRARIMDYVREFRARSGMAPTIPEIAKATGLGETGVRYHLNVLCQQGKAERDNRARSLRLIED